jgi:microcin C transport system substrate-binding protein
MRIHALTAFALFSLLCVSASLPLRAAETVAPPAQPAVASGPVRLPANIVWETNLEDPPIGSPRAIRGGTFNFYMRSYPLTYRLVGPNSNDAFAAWNRLSTFAFGLVEMHPVTDRFIPMMATHWSIQPDQKTIYFKLDRAARFSDGHPVTADDYVFTWKMLQSPHIVDPFYNTYMKEYYASVDKIDDYTLRIVGTRPSWRPLYDYAGFWPTPAHATKLDANWVTRTNNTPQIVAGPYVVSGMERGQSVTLTRVPNWWGDGRRYFNGRFNFDRIKLSVIQPDRTLDYVRRGELDLMVEPSARAWNEEYTFPAVQNGWLRRARVFVDMPTGIGGLHMNLQAPIFQNKDFRKAMQHLFNFDRVNRNLMYGESYRVNSFFEGTEFANPAVKAYPFDPVKARQYLERAGYRRPNAQNRGVFSGLVNAVQGLVLTRSPDDGILVNSRGEKAQFTLIYGSKAYEPHLTIMQQEYRRAGVDMRLQLLEPGASFERALERKFEMILTLWSSGLYPDPRQYLHSQFQKENQNNAIWGFATPEVDRNIETYEKDLDGEARKRAMYRIDEIIHDEAFYIPWWSAPFMRLVYWDYIQFPEFYLPRRSGGPTDYMVFWIDPAKRTALQQAMRQNRAYPLDRNMDKDFYRVRERLQ